MADTIDIALEVTNSTQAQAAIDKTAKSVDGLGASASRVAPAVANAGKAMDQKAANAAKLSAVVGGLSPIIGRASVETAKLTSVFSTAGATVGGLTSVIGGPFGLAMGAAVAAAGLLVTAFSEAESQADKTAKGIASTTQSLEEFIAAAGRAQQASQLQARVGRNEGSLVETEGALSKAKSDLAAVNDAAMQISRAQGFTREVQAVQLTALTRQRMELEESVRRLTATAESKRAIADAEGAFRDALDEAEGNAETNAVKRHKAERARAAMSADDMERELANVVKITDARVAAADAEERRMQRIRAAGVFSQSVNRSQADLMNEASVGRVTGSSSPSAANANGGVQSDEFFSRIQRDSAAFSSDDADVKAKAHEDAANRIKGAYSDAYGVVANAGLQAFAAVIAGQDVAVGALLSGVGQQLAAQGLTHAFEGAARSVASFGVDPSGPALIGIGAAEIAAGAGLGAIGNAATPSASAGASGGPPKPADQMGGSGGDGSSHTTIILNNLVPDAYAGERVREALTRDRHKRGRAAA